MSMRLDSVALENSHVGLEPLTASLMPAGLDKVLTPEELRDLMTYLLRPASLPVK